MHEILRALRERKGWTQGQAAEALGVCRGSINGWERGRSMPTRENLADALRVYEPTEAERAQLVEAAALPRAVEAVVA